eukprot:TRINITY_DN1084_c3_g1_i1.p1 TRINITY_DN1084_c3_g1~~TRINITY_DN1084_c3_g1_i1.p1  ORF type:complete len:341 (+),score=93.07 TRINITY_DN1084_c3_g1_i1:58-1023(+)
MLNNGTAMERKQKELNCEARLWALKEALKQTEEELRLVREGMGEDDKGSISCTIKSFKHIAQCVRESGEWKARPQRCAITAEEATRELLSKFSAEQLTTFRGGSKKSTGKKVFRQFVNPEASMELSRILECAPIIPRDSSVLHLPPNHTSQIQVDLNEADLPVTIDIRGHVIADIPNKPKTFLVGKSNTKKRNEERSTLINVHPDDVAAILKSCEPILVDNGSECVFTYKWNCVSITVRQCGTSYQCDEDDDDKSWTPSGKSGSTESNDPNNTTNNTRSTVITGLHNDDLMSRWEASILTPPKYAIDEDDDFSSPPPLCLA